MPTHTARGCAWIVVRQLSTGKYFPDKATTKISYQRDKDFTVLTRTFPSRQAARAFCKERNT